MGEQSNYPMSPLYDGANIHVDSYSLLFQFSLRHSLSGVGFEDLIKLVSMHLPNESNALNFPPIYFRSTLWSRPQLKLYCDHCFEDEEVSPMIVIA